MRKRYHCPHHDETTPSAVVYGDHYFSFCCGKRGPVSELGLKAGERIEVTYVEDIKESIEAIKRLPKSHIRGLDLHSNAHGYYIVWPDNSYYKYRKLDDDSSGGKYRSPSGHKKPPMILGNKSGVSNKERLVLVEGEINAMSLYECRIPNLYIVSPGGAGDFYSKTAERLLQECVSFDTIEIVVDDDAAGLLAGIECKAKLAALGARNVTINLAKKDFNEVYDKEGEEALIQYATELGLC